MRRYPELINLDIASLSFASTSDPPESFKTSSRNSLLQIRSVQRHVCPAPTWFFLSWSTPSNCARPTYADAAHPAFPQHSTRWCYASTRFVRSARATDTCRTSAQLRSSGTDRRRWRRWRRWRHIIGSFLRVPVLSPVPRPSYPISRNERHLRREYGSGRRCGFAINKRIEKYHPKDNRQHPVPTTPTTHSPTRCTAADGSSR